MTMAEAVITRKFGTIPDKPDDRDYIYKAVLAPTQIKLPSSVNLTSKCPAVYDQGDLGSCTGQAIAGAVAFAHRKVESTDLDPSRLFIYYNERELEGTVSEDAGASIRDGIKVCNQFGVCPEALWPYIISKFAIKPPPNCYTAALKDKVVKYERLMQSSTAFRSCLATGFPFVFGILVYPSFMTAKVATTGVVPMPKADEECLGGHAVMCVGYNDMTRRFIVRNSWGTSWGNRGYFTIPYNYVFSSSLAFDFWKIAMVAPAAARGTAPKTIVPPKPMVAEKPAQEDATVNLSAEKKE
jgi:C1A family cysteine protease